LRVLLFSLFLMFCSPLWAGEQVLFAAEPTWRQSVEIPSSSQLSPINGQRYLLVDRQYYLDSQQVQRFNRYVVQITSTEGLESASQLSFDFDPAYETLTINRVRVWRNGQALDRLEPQELRIFQREADLEHFLYTGAKTAYLILPDIRVGDVLEYSYTLQGNNPVMNNRYGEKIPLDWEIPVARNVLRLVLSPNRALYFQAPKQSDKQLTISDVSGKREILWQEENVPAVVQDEDTPNWYSPFRYLAISEFVDWPDVVKWALPLYEQAAVVDQSVQQQADQFLAQSSDKQQQIMLALGFVQQEIRYLGMEDGMGSHRPRLASETLYRRYGDCKDKTALLLALLKAMGFSPSAALVNLDQGQSLPDELPSPYAFDHVIVTLMLDGKRLWLDGTNLNQGTRLQTVGFPYLRYALLVEPETKGLVSMDSEFRPSRIQINQEIWVEKVANKLRIESRYSGEQAEQQRSNWRNTTPEYMSRNFSDYYSKIYLDADPLGLPLLRDDMENNELTFSEVYSVAGGMQALGQYGLDIYADQIDSYLKSYSDRRRQPMALTSPLQVEQQFVLHFPTHISAAPYRTSEENGVYRFSMQVEPLDGKQIRITYRYENLKDHVPVSELARYRESVRRVKEHLSLNFSVPNKPKK